MYLKMTRKGDNPLIMLLFKSDCRLYLEWTILNLYVLNPFRKYFPFFGWSELDFYTKQIF